MLPFRISLFIALFVVLVACKKRTTVDPTPPTNLNNTVQTDPTSWTLGPLNASYTIKFPANYTGEGGRIQIDGWLFAQDRADKRAKFAYSFCTATGCSEYGQTVLGGKTPSVGSFNGQTLTQSITLTEGDQAFGTFFYSEQTNAVGVLYLLTNGTYRESVNVQFDNVLQAEVLAIIRTIKRKV
ncbi:hypothetical protein FAES_3066 [Fibrella aestuarina BUZ 2]|uniref:Lipocalin-like domain-containing protein n=1 Tax=Fibrella aestuarina BUZ 2 TaxID=1166018 RepID=I0KAC2_9BACT|nr:hypothetical protein [Fibrella aestuarina]CCH01075.1 hypothetical protein FAES_3066 [Fibrella aestuarina BUZ 2]